LEKYDELYEEMKDRSLLNFEDEIDPENTFNIIRKTNIMMALFDAPMFMVFYSQMSAKSSVGNVHENLNHVELQRELKTR
jgi:hypothetical protein